MKYLVYQSDADINKIDLLSLLNKARKNNQSLQITGILVAHANGFIQYIEGDVDVIDELYQHKISVDQRHRNIVTICEGTMTDRVYRDWDMGYLCLSDRQSLNKVISPQSAFDVTRFHDLVQKLLPMVETEKQVV